MSSMARPRGASDLRMPGMDSVLVAAVMVLLGFGIVMVASASMHLAGRNGDILRYVDRHLLALAGRRSRPGAARIGETLRTNTASVKTPTALGRGATSPA